MDFLTIIEINQREDGFHALQSQSGRTECWLDGWIAVPPELADGIWETRGYCELEITDGVLTGFTPLPAPEPKDERTPRQKREDAYNNEAIVEWGGRTLTVTEAATLWEYYAAEGASEEAAELTALIAPAKETIRARYPDDEAEPA